MRSATTGQATTFHTARWRIHSPESKPGPSAPQRRPQPKLFGLACVSGDVSDGTSTRSSRRRTRRALEFAGRVPIGNLVAKPARPARRSGSRITTGETQFWFFERVASSAASKHERAPNILGSGVSSAEYYCNYAKRVDPSLFDRIFAERSLNSYVRPVTKGTRKSRQFGNRSGERRTVGILPIKLPCTTVRFLRQTPVNGCPQANDLSLLRKNSPNASENVGCAVPGRIECPGASLPRPACASVHPKAPHRSSPRM